MMYALHTYRGIQPGRLQAEHLDQSDLSISAS
jgi:hypothetical protein